ncbi:MAG: prepilin-type N-terminal cleavage/methylation domain-containing protein [Verrucomicrobia bacterium]|nr:prepilin-type N-terminal cleavage/methylation domain-containing protein [Verrucomicrobiota bacterium]
MPLAPSRFARAFTLIEIMIVIGILGIILGMGIPGIFRAMKKEGLRAATSDVLEACEQARAAAILTGQVVELQFLTETREFKIVAVSEVSTNQEEALLTQAAQVLGVPEAAPTKPKMPDFSRQLPESVMIEMLDVNFLSMKEWTEARVRFYPNSTSDEFTIVLRSDQNEWRKISLEVTTGLAEMETIR